MSSSRRHSQARMDNGRAGPYEWLQLTEVTVGRRGDPAVVVMGRSLVCVWPP